MEDILASIKRIIADDNHAAEEADGRAEELATPRESSRSGASTLQLVEKYEEPGEEIAEEVLELTQAVEPAESTIKNRPEIAAEEKQEVEMRRPEPNSRSDVSTPEAVILSDQAAIASRQSLAALSALLVKPDNEAGENTLEGLVREMLRPMMKEWLDQKLPELVERLVEKEIGRISGRVI